MKIKIYKKDCQIDLLLLKHKDEQSYSFINLNGEYIDSDKFPSKEAALKYLDSLKGKEIVDYKVADSTSFLDDGIFIGNYFVPNKNPKQINCKRDDLIYDGNRIIGVKDIKFTCDNCSSPMHVMHGSRGFFFGCDNWKTSRSCRNNTISLNILD